MLPQVIGHALYIEGSLQSKNAQLTDSVQSLLGGKDGALLGFAGLPVGNIEGELFGIFVRATVGELEGWEEVGKFVGEMVGAAVGKNVGVLVGLAVGFSVGLILGRFVGFPVGVTVGEVLGELVGVTVGEVLGVVVGVSVGVVLGGLVGITLGK